MTVVEIGNFRQLNSHFRGDISTGCPVAVSAMSRRRNSWATRNSRHFAASSGIGIPEKTASLSSNTRRSTILNDFVIRVVASITNQSRRAETMAASLCPAGTALVRGQRVKSNYVHLTQQLHGRTLARPFAERSL
jgi:hypothetical protein